MQQANAVPVHKKGDKQIFKNYRPVFLLTISGKMFESLIYNNLFEYFIENDLISQNQSGFKSGDLCINQLTSVTHEIYQSFNEGFAVTGTFLDMSKAFDKVWHDGLIYKLRIMEQKVILNGRHSICANVESGVSKGSVLRPLLFLYKK